MARAARIVWPGRPHHLTQRGNNKQSVFLEPADFAFYLCLLRRALPASDTRLLAYSLLENHLHLIVVPGRPDSLTDLTRRVNGSYSAYFNSRQCRCGHVWQTRYFSCVVSDRHVHHALRFVEKNPQRLGLVRREADWNWSSAAAHLTGHDDARVLDMDFWRIRGGSDAWANMLAARYRNGEQIDHLLRRCTFTERPFGDEAFLKSAEERFGRTWNRWTFERTLRSELERKPMAQLHVVPYPRILYAGV